MDMPESSGDRRFIYGIVLLAGAALPLVAYFGLGRTGGSARTPVTNEFGRRVVLADRIDLESSILLTVRQESIELLLEPRTDEYRKLVSILDCVYDTFRPKHGIRVRDNDTIELSQSGQVLFKFYYSAFVDIRQDDGAYQLSLIGGPQSSSADDGTLESRGSVRTKYEELLDFAQNLADGSERD